MNLTDILTEGLVNFIEDLRAADYHIGATQYIAAQELILVLTALGELPSELSRLRTLLAPILCHSLKEQAEFKKHFDNWISQFETRESTPTQPLQDVPDIKTGIKLWKWALIALAIVSISIIISTQITEETVTPRNETIPKEIVQPVPTLPEKTSEDITQREIEQQDQLPTDPKSDFLWLWVILSFLLLLIFLVGLWQILPRFLTRKSADTRPDIKKLFVEKINDKLYQSVSLSRTAQQLRKHKTIPANQLDIVATIEKTVEMAGWFTPITGTRSIRPEYLVLIDRTTFKDHQAELMNSLVNQIITEEVFVPRYYFEGDPRRCYPQKVQLAPLTLTELAERYPEHRLMIFSEGNGLINPITGEIVNWIDQFSVWTHRVLFTLESPEQWGYREQILDRADFLIMPANESSLTALAEQINAGIWQPYPKTFDLFSTEFPDYINERPRRWLERHAPDATVLTELLKQVRYFLGENAYYWLSACAVYPEIRWQLTLYLGYQLKLVTEEHLAKLTRLPWFRYGYMPNWLRERLVADLSHHKKLDDIDIALSAIFKTALDKPLSEFYLEIADDQKTEWLNLRQQRSGRSKNDPKNSSLNDYYVFKTIIKSKLSSVKIPTNKVPNGIILKNLGILFSQAIAKFGKLTVNFFILLKRGFAFVIEQFTFLFVSILRLWKVGFALVFIIFTVVTYTLPLMQYLSDLYPMSNGSNSASIPSDKQPDEPIVEPKLEINDSNSASTQPNKQPDEPIVEPKLEIFRDSPFGPEMVWIPAGRFRMGDIQGGGTYREQPVHWVTVKRFAMSRYEITFAEFDRFAQTIVQINQPDDNNWGRGNRPVINISWKHAVSYTEWLSEQTGHKYRLPTEAEWEYAARAGTTTKYWWGNNIGYNQANCKNCGSQWSGKTAPVGSFSANPFGLFDTVGNVYELTCSEFKQKYSGEEQRCLDKENTDGKSIIIRGGSWSEPKSYGRAAYRNWEFKYIFDQDNMGFRVVREK